MILYNNNNYEYDNYVNILDCMITVIMLMYCFHNKNYQNFWRVPNIGPPLYMLTLISRSTTISKTYRDWVLSLSPFLIYISWGYFD